MRAAVLGVIVALCGLAAGASLGAPAAQPKYSCSGSQVTLFDNTNGYAVDDGGTVPSFSTNGKAYCLTFIQTYHWNSGHGQVPGTLGLVRVNGPAGFPAKVGPFKAKSSSGQNNAPNVNWFVGVPPIPQSTIIDGKYQCSDSGRATWSANPQSGGAGFCIVYAVPATPLATTSGSTSTTTAPPTTTTPPATTTGKAKKCACKGVSITAGGLTAKGKSFTFAYGWTIACTTGTGGCSGSVKVGAVALVGGLTPAPKTKFALVKKTTSYTCHSLCTTSHSGTASAAGKATRSLKQLNGRYLAVTFTLKCGKKSSKVTLSYRINAKS